MENEFAFASPYSFRQFGRGADASKKFGENLGRGLSLAPGVRSRFRTAIRTGAVFQRTAVDASRWHIATMISSQDARDRILLYKLGAIDNGRFSAEMYDWCVPPVPLWTERMPEPIAIAADRILDYPGFIVASERPRLADLIPSLSIQLT